MTLWILTWQSTWMSKFESHSSVANKIKMVRQVPESPSLRAVIIVVCLPNHLITSDHFLRSMKSSPCLSLHALGAIALATRCSRLSKTTLNSIQPCQMKNLTLVLKETALKTASINMRTLISSWRMIAGRKSVNKWLWNRFMTTRYWLLNNNGHSERSRKTWKSRSRMRHVA